MKCTFKSSTGSLLMQKNNSEVMEAIKRQVNHNHVLKKKFQYTIIFSQSASL